MRSEYRARRSYGYSTDDPEGRLPQNMKRIAYDADTRQYTYRDTNGSLWNSSPSVEYGNMYRVSDRVRPQPNFIDMGEESDVDILEPDASPEGRKTVQRLWERVLPRQVTHFDRKIVPISTDTMDTKDSGVAPLSRRELRASRRRALDASESVSFQASRRQSSDTHNLFDEQPLRISEGKESRLRLVAAGERRTIPSRI